MSVASNSADRWKVHPFYLVAVGFGIGVWFAMTWLAPAHQGSLRYEVEDARRELPRMTKKFEAANFRIVALKKELAAARRLLREAQFASLFHSGSPYPVGFGKVRVGDPISSVDREYPAHLIDKGQETYWTVKSAGSLVERTTYYFDDSNKQQLITHVSVTLDRFSETSRLSEMNDFLVAELTEILGAPTAGPRHGYYSWTAPSGEGVFFDGGGNYLIMKAGYGLGYWPAMRNAKR